MKLLTFCAMFLVACGLQAAEPLQWISTVHDFGAFDESLGKMTAQFKFVNTSAEPIAITQAAATCGCTTPTFTQDPVAPGDTAVVSVSYDPAGRPGRFEKYVFVRTSATHDRQKLTIKGVVIGNSSSVSGRYPVDMGPLKLRNGVAMLGRVVAGGGKTEFIDGYNQSADSIRIIFSNVPKYLQVSATPQVVPPGELVNVNFYFRGERCKEWGMINDSIVITTQPGNAHYTMPVVAIVEEDFSALTTQQLADAPRLALVGDRIDLGKVPRNSKKPVVAKIKIQNSGNDPLKIHRVYSQDPAVSVKVKNDEVKKDKTTELTITYDPSGQPDGVINTRMIIISNDPSAPTRTLRIVADRN